MFSLYDAVVPQLIQITTAVRGLLDKAEAHCKSKGIAPAELIQARLYEDMLPFASQIALVVAHSKTAIESVRGGVFTPDRSPPPATLPELAAMLDKTITFLKAVKPEDLNSFIGKDMRFDAGEFKLPFTVETYMLSFAQPNFYFHATTAYGILRNKGVQIGKRDFMGALQLKR